MAQDTRPLGPNLPRRLAAWGAQAWRALGLCLALFFGPAAAVAAPRVSCDLEHWLMSLETASAQFVQAAGTDEEELAALSLRRTLQRYPEARVRKQISDSGLGANSSALQAYVDARRYVVGLGQMALVDEARSYITDPRFTMQGQVLTAFLTRNNCTEEAPNHLEVTPLQSGSGKVREKVLGDTDVAYADNAARARADGNRGSGGEDGPPVEIVQPSPKKAFQTLGIIAGLGITTSGWWMRHKMLRRRARRHTCAIEIAFTHMDQTTAARIVDISQIGAKVACDQCLPPRSRVTLENRFGTLEAKVAWSNEHFMGVIFAAPLSQSDLASLLAPAVEFPFGEAAQTHPLRPVA